MTNKNKVLDTLEVYMRLFHLHKWNKWSVMSKDNIEDKYDSVVGVIIVQIRTCEECNLNEYKKTEILI